jgi:hypothetical protein
MNTAALVRSAADADAADPPHAPARREQAAAAHALPPAGQLKKSTTAANTGAGTAVDAPEFSDSGSSTQSSSRTKPLRGDLLLYLLLTVMVAAAWRLTHMGLFKSGDKIGYWIGVCGGTMMLLLFTYPLRKYVRFMGRLGHVKWWFWVHVALGILGPWLILVHSNFHLGSLNASIALYSMVAVVLSGVVGRFIYVRINRGLDGERTSLRILQTRAGFVESNVRSRLHFAPAVEAALLAFETRELKAQPTWATHLRQVCLLPLQAWFVFWRCRLGLRNPLRELALRRKWSAKDYARRSRHSRRLVRRYLDAVIRVAQFTAFERLFALWHLVHVPFIYLLVITAIVHVLVVHAY